MLINSVPPRLLPTQAVFAMLKTFRPEKLCRALASIQRLASSGSRTIQPDPKTHPPGRFRSAVSRAAGTGGPPVCGRPAGARTGSRPPPAIPVFRGRWFEVPTSRCSFPRPRRCRTSIPNARIVFFGHFFRCGFNLRSFSTSNKSWLRPADVFNFSRVP